MKKSTKQLIGFAAVGALVISAASGVFAQGGFVPGYGPGWGSHHGMMGGPVAGRGPCVQQTASTGVGIEQRLSDQKDRIGITAEQESAWSAYTSALKGKYELMQSHRQARFGGAGVDNSQLQSFRQDGLNQMQKVLKATQDLYAVLTPEQQARAGNLIGPRHGMRF